MIKQALLAFCLLLVSACVMRADTYTVGTDTSKAMDAPLTSKLFQNNDNFGATTDYNIGRVNSSNDDTRLLIQFDLSGYTGTTDQIDTVIMILYQNKPS